MAYNHGREDRKWRIWKEAEEKLLREDVYKRQELGPPAAYL